MAGLTIAGRSFEIAPYKLGALRRAAPHIDAINAGASISTVEGMMENIEHVIGVLAVGLTKIDPAMTAETLLDMVGIDDMAALSTALTDVLQESGLAPKGEAMAPSEPQTAGA